MEYGWTQCRELLGRNIKSKPEREAWKEVTQLLTLTLLSLLLPLSFLLLARLSTAHYVLAVFGGPLVPASLSSSILSYIFLYVNSTLLYSLLSLVTVAALVRGLTDRVTRPCPYVAWILLCSLQVCVGLGIEGSIAAGIDASGFRQQTSLVSKVMFFLGLHDTMLFWSASVVKPVVDDTVRLGYVKEERWMERLVMGSSFGGLWWWRLRQEVDSLVAVGEVRWGVLGAVGVADFMSWWLYYMTVIIGGVRVVKGVRWIGGMRILSGEVDESIFNNTTTTTKVKSNLVDYAQLNEKL